MCASASRVCAVAKCKKLLFTPASRFLRNWISTGLFENFSKNEKSKHRRTSERMRHKERNEKNENTFHSTYFCVNMKRDLNWTLKETKNGGTKKLKTGGALRCAYAQVLSFTLKRCIQHVAGQWIHFCFICGAMHEFVDVFHPTDHRPIADKFRMARETETAAKMKIIVDIDMMRNDDGRHVVRSWQRRWWAWKRHKTHETNVSRGGREGGGGEYSKRVVSATIRLGSTRTSRWKRNSLCMFEFAINFVQTKSYFQFSFGLRHYLPSSFVGSMHFWWLPHDCRCRRRGVRKYKHNLCRNDRCVPTAEC